MNVVVYKGKLFAFQNTLDEPKTIFIERNWFIAKNYEKFVNDMATLERLSHIYVNHKFLESNYDDDVMSMLKNCNKIYDM